MYLYPNKLLTAHFFFSLKYIKVAKPHGIHVKRYFITRYFTKEKLRVILCCHVEYYKLAIINNYCILLPLTS